jgi:GntR family transcriptional regulator, transcriptional repressor for pyruvate dehydrogenase complex
MKANVPQSTLTFTTIECILEFIREKKLQAGESLPSEVEMIKMFGVSRVILREAFSYLKGLGIIESRRGSSFKIAKTDFVKVLERTLKHIAFFNQDNIEGLFDLRRRLEIGSVGDAVTNANEKDIENIRCAMGKLEAFAVKKVKTLTEHELLELEFHQAIVKPSGNQVLALVNVALKNYFDVSFGTKIARSHSSMSNLERELLEHRMITHAFILRWPEIAESCLRKHLSHKLK